MLFPVLAGLGCLLMSNPKRRRRRKGRRNPVDHVAEYARLNAIARAHHDAAFRSSRSKAAAKRHWTKADKYQAEAMEHFRQLTKEQQESIQRGEMKSLGEGFVRALVGGKKRKNPARNLIHAASILGDKPTTRVRTACGMPLMEVYSSSPFAEEATCPACRAATAADKNWWRKRRNPASHWWYLEVRYDEDGEPSKSWRQTNHAVIASSAPEKATKSKRWKRGRAVDPAVVARDIEMAGARRAINPRRKRRS